MRYTRVSSAYATGHDFQLPKLDHSKRRASSGVGRYLEVGDNWEGGWQGPKGFSLRPRGPERRWGSWERDSKPLPRARVHTIGPVPVFPFKMSSKCSRISHLEHLKRLKYSKTRWLELRPVPTGGTYSVPQNHSSWEGAGAYSITQSLTQLILCPRTEAFASEQLFNIKSKGENTAELSIQLIIKHAYLFFLIRNTSFRMPVSFVRIHIVPLLETKSKTLWAPLIY